MGVGEQKVSLLDVLRQGRKGDRKGVLKQDRTSRTLHEFVCSSTSATVLFLEETGILPHLYTNQGSGMVDHPCARRAEGHKILQVSIETEDKLIAT